MRAFIYHAHRYAIILIAVTGLVGCLIYATRSQYVIREGHLFGVDRLYAEPRVMKIVSIPLKISDTSNHEHGRNLIMTSVRGDLRLKTYLSLGKGIRTSSIPDISLRIFARLFDSFFP